MENEFSFHCFAKNGQNWQNNLITYNIDPLAADEMVDCQWTSPEGLHFKVKENSILTTDGKVPLDSINMQVGHKVRILHLTFT
jgi:hypothetical protein